MTPDRLKALREKLTLARQPDEKLTEQRVFLRGWNAGLDYVEKTIDEIFGKAEP